MLNEKTINGKLNIFLLHKPEDNKGIRCIRIVFSKELKETIIKTLKILGHENEKSQINFIVNNVPWKTTKDLVRDWFKGKNDIPLVLIRNICQKILESNMSEIQKVELVENLLKHSRWLTSSRSNKKVFVPLKISDELFHIVGVIVGDGSLPKIKSTKGHKIFSIVIEKANEHFIKYVMKREFLDIFKVEAIIRKIVRKNKPQPTWRFMITSKPLARFFTELFDIPRGKKSHKIRISKIIRDLEPIDRVPFIAGLMDTDWGHHHWCFGTGSASRKLIEDTKETLEILLNSKISIDEQNHASFMWLKKGQIQELNTLLNNRFQLRNLKRIRTIEKFIGSPVV